MSAISTIAKCTLTAMTPFAAVYFWPKESQVVYYIPKNSTTPLLSLPRPSVAIPAIKAPEVAKPQIHLL
jgi:hypothetical protein